MDFSFPFIITTFNQDFDVMCKVELFTHFLLKEYFQPETLNRGSVLEIQCMVPHMFANEERVLQANSENQGFNYNTHEAQAHKDACEMIDNYFPNSVMIGNNQKIKLPFPCDERIVSWECQAYANDLLNDELFVEEETEEGQQYNNILVITLQKI